MADIVVLTDEKSVFFVDEPELNLHPALAERFWSSIERTYQEYVFVYATHSLSFAMRDDIDALFVLRYGQIDRNFLSDNPTDLRPFLGSIPGIVRSKKCLFVEGEEASFDAQFYKWLVGDQKLEILPLGSSSAVISASARSGVWSKIGTDVIIAGVIDRDFKSLDAQGDKNLIFMEMHEAESYLCHPDILINLKRALSNTVNIFTQNDAVAEIIRVANERFLYIVAQRVFTRCGINLRLSVERSDLALAKSMSELHSIIIEASKMESRKAQDIFDPVKMDELIVSEENICREAIDTLDINNLLTIFEGKNLLKILSPKIGCSQSSGMLSAVTKHLDPTDYLHLNTLRTALRNALNY